MMAQEDLTLSQGDDLIEFSFAVITFAYLTARPLPGRRLHHLSLHRLSVAWTKA